MRCRCSQAREHRLWLCTCGAMVAEGCVDVALWDPFTVPAGVTPDQRWTC